MRNGLRARAVMTQPGWPQRLMLTRFCSRHLLVPIPDGFSGKFFRSRRPLLRCRTRFIFSVNSIVPEVILLFLPYFL